MRWNLCLVEVARCFTITSMLLFPPYAVELTYISNRDQTCKHCRGGCSWWWMGLLLALTGDEGKRMGLGPWNCCSLVLLPVYCRRQKPPFNHSALCFSLSPAAKNIFTLRQEKMNSCLQDLYCALCYTIATQWDAQVETALMIDKSWELFKFFLLFNDYQ